MVKEKAAGWWYRQAGQTRRPEMRGRTFENKLTCCFGLIAKAFENIYVDFLFQCRVSGEKGSRVLFARIVTDYNREIETSSRD